MLSSLTQRLKPIERINLTYLNDIRSATDAETVKQLIGVFMVTMGSDLDRLTAALDVDDIDTAKSRCHAMKGAAGSIGAQLLAERCIELEQALHASAGPAEIAAHARSVSDEFQASKDALVAT